MMSDAGNNTSALLAELLTLPGERRLARVRESLGEFASESTKVTDALVSLGDEAERLAVVEVSRALSASELSVSLADEANAPRARARARRARGQALAYAGRFDEALGLCAEAERIATAHGETIEAARAKLASMHALSELGRYDEAIRAGETARQAFLAAGRPELAARADINLGVTLQNRDAPAAALVHLDRAREALRSEPLLLGHVDNNRGEALLLLSEFTDAESAFLTAMRTYEEAGLDLVAALAEGNLADLAARQGLLQRSLYHFERARRHMERVNAGSHLARLKTEQAEAIGALGLADEAIMSYQAVLPELREHGLAWETCRALAGMGRALMALGRFDDAEGVLGEASSGFQELNHSTARARVDLLRAEMAQNQGHLDDALSLARRAFEMLRDRPAESAVARHRLARLAFEQGDLTAVEAELAAALPVAEQLDIAPLLADLLRLRGQLRHRQGNLDAAIIDLTASVAQVERVRGSLQADRFRAAYLGNRLAAYEDLVSVLLDRGGAQALAEAFKVVERIKSRSLLDLVRGAIETVEAHARSAQAQPQDAAEQTMLAELARLRSELNALYSRLAADGRQGERRIAMNEWQMALRKREKALERLQSRLSSTRGIGGLFAEPIDLHQTRSIMDCDSALVEYYLSEGELMAFVVTSADELVVRAMAKPADLQERIARAQFQLRRALRQTAGSPATAERLLADARRELHSLWSILIKPLHSAIKSAQRLIIVPHGPLHLLPFHALWDGHAFLIERHEFVYAPSASVLAHAAGQGEQSLPKTFASLVVGVADQAAPRIEQEARQIASILRTDRLMMNGTATADNFTMAAVDAFVIHLACHGRFSSSSPLTSGLRLSDRWLTAREIYGLRLNADLVTLSGCETGRHLVTRGDEILGLVRGFLAAGASSLLVSLWTANDESTAEMMGRFYELWRSQSSPGLSKAAALRQAQLQAMARRPHPTCWAPFVLVGRS